MELFKTSCLFDLTNGCDKRIIAHQGGRRSTKSYTIIQVMFTRAIQKSGYIGIVVGWDMPHMKRGIILDMLRFIRSYPLLNPYIKSFNLQETKLYLQNGSFIQFSSFHDEQDAKMTDIDDAYLNECNLIKGGFGIFNQMNMQAKGKIYLDYNSMAPFWVHSKLLGRDDVKLFISDHRHNPYITPEQHHIIETQFPKDSELWKVYARGYTGKVEGSIYKNWVQVKEWPKNIEEVIWGIDYGYTIGMTAIVKIGIVGRRTLAVKLCCYQPAINEETIKKIMEENGYVSGAPFYSEHDPEKVAGLRRLGMVVFLALKGELSEWNGILKAQEFDVEYIYADDLQWELVNYQWETVTSLETGDEILTQSVKDTKRFHAMAGFRYAVYSHFFGR